jgi:hypothetical protein
LTYLATNAQSTYLPYTIHVNHVMKASVTLVSSLCMPVWLAMTTRGEHLDLSSVYSNCINLWSALFNHAEMCLLLTWAFACKMWSDTLLSLLLNSMGGQLELTKETSGIMWLKCLNTVLVLTVCMPFTSSCLMVSNFALCVMPFLSGFYSRDFILEIFLWDMWICLGFFCCFYLVVWQFVIVFVCFILLYVM